MRVARDAVGALTALTEGAAGILLVDVALLGLARGFFEGSHVRLSMAERAFGGRLRAAVRLAVTGLSLATLVVLALYGINGTLEFSRRTLTAISMPRSPWSCWARSSPASRPSPRPRSSGSS